MVLDKQKETRIYLKIVKKLNEKNIFIYFLILLPIFTLYKKVSNSKSSSQTPKY